MSVNFAMFLCDWMDLIVICGMGEVQMNFLLSGELKGDKIPLEAEYRLESLTTLLNSPTWGFAV